MKHHIRQNWQIKAPQVRLIDENGAQVGVVSSKEALKMAETAGLDLIEISPNATPPVCKITDYGKYCYLLVKKEKESKKKQKNVDVKEVKFTYKIGEHDYQTKMRNCVRFLEKGHNVKISMFFRGREKAHIDLGEVVLNRICTDLEDLAQVDKRTRLMGSTITMILTPK
ncbi:MAG: translation initiation factor IF-3 [Candidatus Omnitrophota bacterium]